MGRFTFAAGNSRKIAALPLYALGRAAASVVRRSPRLWVFGSGTGVGEGALALLRQVRAHDPSARVVWLARGARDVTDARALGIPVAYRNSWRGFRLTLRAGVLVVTHGFGDVNRFATHGALVVNVWHGIPFKRLRIDSPEAMRVPVLGRLPFVGRVVRRAYARAGRGVGVFATASPLSAARIRSAFALTERQAVVTGDPRDDVLLAGPKADRERAARERIAVALNEPRALASRIVMYAPTWRDGRQHPSTPTPEEWLALDALLERTDSLLLIRVHPLGRGDFAAGVAASDRVALFGAELQPDLNPVLSAVDTLITDYSSVAFDFALTGGSILFLAPDVAEYAGRRGTYEPYADFSGGREVASWASLIPLLESTLTDASARAPFVEHAQWLADRYHSFHDGRATERLYDVITRRLAGETDAMPPAPPAALAAVPLEIDAFRVEGEAEVGFALVFEGPDWSRAPESVLLRGTRAVLPGTVATEGSRWRARIPLAHSDFGTAPLPPRSGSYALTLHAPGGHPLDLNVTAALPSERRYGDAFRLAAVAARGAVTVELSAPLADDEVGRGAQQRLFAGYRASQAPLEHAVFFESYYGNNVSCNPLGIDRALAARHPEVTRYWSVADASMSVPDGAVPVIDGSAEWWRARAVARVLVVNDWLRKRWNPRPGQTALQTWHGTPLKKLALDKSGVRLRARLASRAEGRRWDIMLAQNPFSAEIFRSAYAFRGPMWEEGYPRNDIVARGEGGEAIRARLGVEPGTTVVLYAPTWRDDRPAAVDHLDVAAFARRLGPGFVTLIRGHSRTLQPGASVAAHGVIDVTGYPEISELYLAADVLITDYSSVMFDFSVTGKPIFFYVPDFEHYRDRTRGFTFDLFPAAPGPVTTSLSELADAVTDASAAVASHATRYDDWRRRFNPRDDGRAGERVVERIFREGLL